MLTYEELLECMKTGLPTERNSTTQKTNNYDEYLADNEGGEQANARFPRQIYQAVNPEMEDELYDDNDNLSLHPNNTTSSSESILDITTAFNEMHISNNNNN